MAQAEWPLVTSRLFYVKDSTFKPWVTDKPQGDPERFCRAKGREEGAPWQQISQSLFFDYLAPREMWDAVWKGGSLYGFH